MCEELRSIFSFEGRHGQAKVQELFLLHSLKGESFFFELTKLLFNKLIVSWVFIDVEVDEHTKLVNTQQTFKSIH